MKISCGFMYVIAKYGFPPTIENMLKACNEMADMGFKYVEMEGVRQKFPITRNEKRRGVWRIGEWGLSVVNKFDGQTTPLWFLILR